MFAIATATATVPRSQSQLLPRSRAPIPCCHAMRRPVAGSQPPLLLSSVRATLPSSAIVKPCRAAILGNDDNEEEYNNEIAASDDEDDLSKMDMGGQAKGRLHRWDFETEEEWAKYNDQKEAMPKAAFQFGVKMQDGRKTRKQNKDQKLTNDLHKINKILARKKGEKDGDDGGHYDDDLPSSKKQRA